MVQRLFKPLLTVALFGSTFCLWSQPVPPQRANDARIDRLLGQMTLEEKMDLIRGAVEPAATNQGQAGYLPGVPRLGIPSLRMADGPPGLLTRVPAQAETASMGVAATWSRKAAEANGVVIGREARSLGIDVVLQPFINLDRDITFARGYNTFGEDPYLSGQMGAAEIHGIQAQDIMAQAKHYVGYDTDSFNVRIDPQTLHEVYVAPFAAAVKAGVSSIMCSYNRLNRPFACGNADTLKTILKGELGFKGFVTSDWGAVHSVRFINEGLDMEMPGQMSPESPLGAMMHTYFRTGPAPAPPATKPNLAALAGILGGTIPEEPDSSGLDLSTFPRDTDPLTMPEALKQGIVTEATITAAARRVLYEMDRFGYLDGKQKHNVTPQDIEENAKVIERTAEEAAVLLKNEDGILPLKPADLNSLAMIGPTAGQVAAIGTFGERSPGIPERQVGPVDALRKLSPDAKVVFAVDDDMTGVPIPASAFSHNGQPGLERTGTGGVTTVDTALDFTRSNGKALAPNTSATWKGDLTLPSAGSYWLYLQVLGGRGVITIDGKELGRTGAAAGTVHGDIQHSSQDNGLPTTDGLDNVRRAIDLGAGKHAISIQLTPDTSNAPAQIRLNWMTPELRSQRHDEAIAAAKSAHTAVVFLWTRGKPDFGLPGEQDKLVDDIAAVNPNTVVVLNTSRPVALPWLSKVKAVLEMWWPGDEGGWATAKILLGQADPAGRLPMTWAKRLEDYPATDPSHPERSVKGVDGVTTFSEGLLVGYRWFDAQHIDPLFPFGYGLGYTQFALANFAATRNPDCGATITVQVRNTGSVSGDAVPQIYLDAPQQQSESAAFAPRTLVGFDRLTLAPGEVKTISMNIEPRAFQYWSVKAGDWRMPSGSRTLHIGLSSRDLALAATLP
ncbi:glycoside hydrolase family 3 C-terminal domain-containing protein [Alloacidobacterium sp.]|uniref:glycoside hydrolase family 3 C-terminal domain-containing protein n=1 Tax=Alloacidobacterium sp. TaxID=2951999 RepID=UPI002D6BD288|nr:glycoside hydrolase family 3 C-terminal domain-containing protein [Alloacidobacterium sp.]HYK34780.1 glycoside hydrolase family 3 C-terminal domain-containing protein [Alloacidobacterium sp.]